MTIKEMEQLTGLTRANIRFYESEGLLHPQRQDNGYRSYTPEEDDPGALGLRYQLMFSITKTDLKSR